MLYLVLFGTLFCHTVKGYSGKKLSSFVKSPADTYLFNLLRMVFCILIGVCLVFAENSQSFLMLDVGMLAICVLSGISNAMLIVFWMLAVRLNSMVSVDVGMTLGSLIPSLLCWILFNEAFSLLRMIGFIIILLSTFILSGGSKRDKAIKSSGIVFLVLAAVGDGMTGFSQQLYRQYYTDSGSLANEIYYPKTVFHLYTYVFAAIILFAFFVGYRIYMLKKSKTEVQNTTAKNSQKSLSPRVVAHVFVMAVCLFAANYLQTVAANDYHLSSQIMYPIIKGGCLITVNIVAMAFFGEKITKRSIVGSLVAIIGILTMSIL